MTRKLKQEIHYPDPSPTPEARARAAKRGQVPEIDLPAGAVVDLGALPPKLVATLLAMKVFEPTADEIEIETKALEREHRRLRGQPEPEEDPAIEPEPAPAPLEFHEEPEHGHEE